MPRANNYSPPGETGRSVAQTIVERFTAHCGKPCEIVWGIPDSEVASSALQLLGWSTAGPILDAKEKHPLCYSLFLFSGDALFKLDKRLSFGEWSPQEIAKLRKHFAGLPEFPSDKELSAITSLEKAREVAELAGLVSTDSSKRVVLWYLSLLDERLQAQHLPPDDMGRIIGGVDLRLFTPVPEACPLLLKLALNSGRAEKPGIPRSAHYQEILRHGAVATIGKTYNTTLTGIIHIAMVMDEPEFAGNYIRIASSNAAELDRTLVEELLRPNSGADRADIADSLGQSGDRSYRGLLWPLLKDEDGQVRYAAARGLAHLGDASGLPLLEEQIRQGSSEDIREAAIAALGKLGNPDACRLLVEQLRSYIASGNKILPMHIAQAMRDTCTDSFLDDLFAIRSESGELHKYAALAIKAVVNKGSLAKLAEHLDDKDAEAGELAANLILELTEIEPGENETSIDAARRWLQQGHNL